MYFSINAYKALLGLDGTYRLCKNGDWRSNIDFKSFDEEHDMLFITYKDAELWLKRNPEVEIDGVMARVRDKEQTMTLGERKIDFEIIVHRVSKPTNLYATREQIKEVLKEGDDSYNNCLVIDYDGLPQLLKLINQMPYLVTSYPVRLETFNARNRYVGDHIKIDDVDETYMALLETWNLHILTGRQFYRDYVSGDKKEEELIDEILEKTSLLL